jgi:hypothetical protein
MRDDCKTSRFEVGAYRIRNRSDATNKALVIMWERRAELNGFAPTMEGVRNSVPGLKGRALSGPHDYEQIPALVERSKRRVANYYADFDARPEEVPFVAGFARLADAMLRHAVEYQRS